MSYYSNPTTLPPAGGPSHHKIYV